MREVALVVGEALVDVVKGPGQEVRAHAGGSCANAAVALRRLGRETWFASAWAPDRYGRLLATHLSANGVRLAVDPLVLEHTATAVAALAEDGSASYEFEIGWRLPVTSLGSGVLPAVLVYGSLGAALAPGADDVAALVASMGKQVLTVFDLNARPVITGTGESVVARATQMAGLADVVKASDEDLAALWPGRSLREVADELLLGRTGAVVVTRGSEGVTWFGGTSEETVAAVRVEVVDTIGAGDTVTAALVDGLWSRGVIGAAASLRLAALEPTDWRAVLHFAARAAAVTVGRPGADPPARSDLT